MKVSMALVLPSTPLGPVQAARQGVAPAGAGCVAQRLGTTDREKAGLLHQSEATFHRQSRRDRLYAPLSERVLLLAARAKQGVQLFADGGPFRRWLRRPLVYSATPPERCWLEVPVHPNGTPLSDLPPLLLCAAGWQRLWMKFFMKKRAGRPRAFSRRG